MLYLSNANLRVSSSGSFCMSVCQSNVADSRTGTIHAGMLKAFTEYGKRMLKEKQEQLNIWWTVKIYYFLLQHFFFFFC